MPSFSKGFNMLKKGLIRCDGCNAIYKESEAKGNCKYCGKSIVKKKVAVKPVKKSKKK